MNSILFAIRLYHVTSTFFRQFQPYLKRFCCFVNLVIAWSESPINCFRTTLLLSRLMIFIYSKINAKALLFFPSTCFCHRLGHHQSSNHHQSILLWNQILQSSWQSSIIVNTWIIHLKIFFVVDVSRIFKCALSLCLEIVFEIQLFFGSFFWFFKKKIFLDEAVSVWSNVSGVPVPRFSSEPISRPRFESPRRQRRTKGISESSQTSQIPGGCSYWKVTNYNENEKSRFTVSTTSCQQQHQHYTIFLIELSILTLSHSGQGFFPIVHRDSLSFLFCWVELSCRISASVVSTWCLFFWSTLMVDLEWDFFFFKII